MTFEPIDVDAALAELHRALALRPDVRSEFAHSLAEFAALSAQDAQEDELRRAARRHVEWFLLERPSAALGGAPIEWAVHNSAELGECDLGEVTLKALLSSRCGVFEITTVTPGDGAWVRDVGAGGEYPLYEPDASLELKSGDLIVGRLFAVGDSLYSVSPAAGVFRNSKLRDALVHDVEALRKGRRGVLRLSQLELEGMFWGGNHAAPQIADAIARAQEFLVRSGLGDARARELLEELGSAPYEPERWAPGLRDGLAAVLERVAFESDVDLEQARRVLLAAWPALAQRASLGGAPAVERMSRAPTRVADPKAPRGDVRAAMEAFDRGRDAGRDLEELFGELERDLELEPEEFDPDAIDGAPAPDFPGVVAAMVGEFLWETECEQGAEAGRAMAPIAKFAQFGENIGVFDNIGAHELLLFATVWLPERGELETAEQAIAVLAALERFCAWAQATQDVGLHDAYRAQVAPLEHALPRIIGANALRPAGSRDPQRGAMYEVLELDGDTVLLRDRHGHEQRGQISGELAARLESGDWLRASVEEPVAVVHCCYPAQVAQLAP